MDNCFSADTSIGLLAMSPPAYNALMRAGIRKIGDIAALTQEELAAIRTSLPRQSMKSCRFLASADCPSLSRALEALRNSRPPILSLMGRMGSISPPRIP